MTNSRVDNLTRGFSLKHKQALRAVEVCSAAWVVFGVSIRDLTYEEAITARNQQAKLKEPLAYAEGWGLFFQPPANREYDNRQSRNLMFEANRFCANA